MKKIHFFILLLILINILLWSSVLKSYNHKSEKVPVETIRYA